MTSEDKEITEALPTADDDAPDRLSRGEMVDQLGVMARQIAGDAPPAVREASVVVAELTAIAARNTGPIAHILADATDDASLRLAKRLEDYAANVRQEDGTVIPADADEETPDAAPKTQS